MPINNKRCFRSIYDAVQRIRPTARQRCGQRTDPAASVYLVLGGPEADSEDDMANLGPTNPKGVMSATEVLAPGRRHSGNQPDVQPDRKNGQQGLPKSQMRQSRRRRSAAEKAAYEKSRQAHLD